MAIITDTDSWEQAAKKIYREFVINQSCSINGLVEIGQEDFEEKGKLVLNELKRMYDIEFVRSVGKGKMLRRFKNIPESIGGPKAHPCWKYKRHIVDGKVRYTIWRIQ